jgi:head-tail adaptor
MITVGELDTPITIQSPTYGSNANYGGIQETTWGNPNAEITSVWAYMIWKGGSEREEGDQKVGEQKVDFYIRYETYKEDILPNWRIKYKNSGGGFYYYYIEKIAHIDGRHKITRLTAVQKDNY